LSLDLLGIVPTPSEVDAFVKDERPNAYELLVRRLLDSPHFGERWGRHWLDLARYADSDGYEKDNRRPWAWRFRDWTIAAIHRDLPLDQFTREQHAGALLPHAGIEQRVATGFHRNTLTNTEGGTDQEEFRVKAVIDRVNTTGSIWLGLPVGCSQCHTHKYDPLTQREYYGLFAFFNNADERNIPAPLPNEAEKHEHALAEHAKKREELEAQVTSYEKTRSAELDAWIAQVKPIHWKPLEIREAKTASGAKLDSREAGALIASGKNEENDSYTIAARSELRVITALRLEVLTDGSLPMKGPGRAPNGNFVLSEIELHVVAEGDPKSMRPVKFSRASADHSQNEFAVSKAIDGDKKAHGWAIAGGPGGLNRRRVAIFELAEPIRSARGAELVLNLHQNHGGQHTIGHLRLSVVSAASSDLAADPALVDIVSNPAENRSDADKARLRSIFFDGDKKWRELRNAVSAHDKKKPGRSSTQAQVLVERAGGRRKTNLLIRGEFLRKGPEVVAGTPRVLHPYGGNVEKATRLDLANWILDAKNPLTTRVTVNRWWRHLFSRGIVASIDDFGTRGDKPTHPELLDWLASELPKRGWSRKAMIELIVSSATYRQTSVRREELEDVDPQNELLARQNRFRVEAEIVRDLSLAASGLLYDKIGGPSVRPPLPPGVADLGYANSVKWPESKGRDRHRRGMYIFFQRTVPYPMLMSFDSPDSNVSCLLRSRSNTPLQALTLLNDRVFFECAQALGARALREVPEDLELGLDRLTRMFRWCLSREPKKPELLRLRTLLSQARRICAEDPEGAKKMVAGQEIDGVETEELAAWIAVARVLLNLDEFISRE